LSPFTAPSVLWEPTDVLKRTTEGDNSTFIWLALQCITCRAVQGRNVIV